MIKWPWASRARYDKSIEHAYNIREAGFVYQRDLYKAQLDTANARLARIAALETPNAAHGVRKAAKIAKGEL